MRDILKLFQTGLPSPAIHDVENAVFGAFRAHGIEIPLPQRDLHARSWSPEQPSSPSMLTAKE